MDDADETTVPNKPTGTSSAATPDRVDEDLTEEPVVAPGATSEVSAATSGDDGERSNGERERSQRRIEDLPPPSRRYGVGRVLRGIAGCDERILAACPEERFKFSGFGAVILGTASLAALSMTVGLSIIFEQPAITMLPFGLFWGLFILTLDRWLVSAESADLRNVLPRLIIAAFFGFIIAEPMVLLAFDDAITESIDDSAADEIGAYQGELSRCNPEIVEPLVAPPTVEGCDDAILALDRPPVPVLSGATSQQQSDHTRLSNQIAAIDEQLLAERQALADEVGGEVGTGLSGRAGDGSAAAARRETIAGLEADRERLQGELDTLNAATGDIGGDQAAIEADAVAAAATYNTARSEAIEKLVEERAEEVNAKPGLSRRMDRLSELMSESSTIFFARILLTGFFVVIDTAPAVIRMTSSGGAYDTIRSLRLQGREQRERVRRAIEAADLEAEKQIALQGSKQRTAVAKKQIDLEEHVQLARIEQRLDQEFEWQEQSILAGARANGSDRVP